MDYQFGLIYDCVTTDSNVLHQSYLQRLSCINIRCSSRKWGRLKKDFEFRISILCFRWHTQQVSLRPLHCDVECFDCGGWKYFQSCQVLCFCVFFTGCYMISVLQYVVMIALLYAVKRALLFFVITDSH